MNIAEFLDKEGDKKGFSFEVLPPLKGNGTAALFRTIDSLKEFGPRFINITTHHSEYVYKELENGLLTRQRVRRRPGTVAIAGAIQNKYDIPVIPHVICSGASKEDIEYELLDLQFLGISNVLLLRGDKAKEDRQFAPTPNGHAHATDLLKQVAQFNEGFFADGTPIKHPGEKFCYGVACYPEKHEEAPNLEMDMQHLLEKQQLGSSTTTRSSTSLWRRLDRWASRFLSSLPSSHSPNSPSSPSCLRPSIATSQRHSPRRY